MALPLRLFAALAAAIAAAGSPRPARAQASAPAPPGDEGPLRRRPRDGGALPPPTPLRQGEGAPAPWAGGDASDDGGPLRRRDAGDDGGPLRRGDADDDGGPLRRREHVRAGPAPSRAPRFALWAGGRLGAEVPIGEAFDDFAARRFDERELVGPGVALEVDVGARLGQRFLPFAFAQRLFASAGSAPSPPLAASEAAAPPVDARVDSSSAFALGFGFRYEFRPDGLGPAVELAYAFRKTNVTFANGQGLSAEAPGEVRIGVGASFRVADALTLSPLVTFAAGGYSDALIEASDGRERAVAAESPLHGYLGLSLGAHVDLFGKR